MNFQDPYNPTPDELRNWATRGDNMEPVQDFDLMVTSEENIALILELASDETCGKQGFFLSCLYLFVGDAVRSGFNTAHKETVESVLSRAEFVRSPVIALWLRQARALLNEPRSFAYKNWCDGHLASQNRAANQGTP